MTILDDRGSEQLVRGLWTDAGFWRVCTRRIIKVWLTTVAVMLIVLAARWLENLLNTGWMSGIAGKAWLDAVRFWLVFCGLIAMLVLIPIAVVMVIMTWQNFRAGKVVRGSGGGASCRAWL